MLASTLFARAPDLSKILKHVCERHFSNQADTIKEYSIAVEALGRGPDFRPEEDSIVRVQAARLRKHLKKYYETDGVDHTLQLRISATGYRPEFVDSGRLEGRDPGVAAERNSNAKLATRPAELYSLETPQPLSAADESDPAIVSDRGAVVDQTDARRSSLSRGKLGLMLALLATASIVAVVGFAVKYRSVAPQAEPRSAPPAMPAPGGGIKIRAGLTDPTYLDASGSTWLGDRSFTGGDTYTRAGNQILRTFDQPLYQTGRRGSFRYAIPLPQGVYEMHLHFAEVFWGLTVGADTQRTFKVSVNGVPLMGSFDIAKDAGGVYIAVEKVFKDVSPGKDGFLRLDFSPGRGEALLSGIEVLPGVRGKMMPVRILCSNHSGLDKHAQLWKADQYFSGGRIAERPDYIQDPNFGGFSSYRTGNFNYAIPVADGVYRVRLIFAEPVYGRDTSLSIGAGGAGYRVFDVYCSGRTLASGIDIYREAGGGYRVIEKTFRNLKPDAQGKLLLSFVPVRGYAVLLALEVLDENW